jgi:hypothetical protein
MGIPNYREERVYFPVRDHRIKDARQASITRSLEINHHALDGDIATEPQRCHLKVDV